MLIILQEYGFQDGQDTLILGEYGFQDGQDILILEEYGFQDGWDHRNLQFLEDSRILDAYNPAGIRLPGPPGHQNP